MWLFLKLKHNLLAMLYREMVRMATKKMKRVFMTRHHSSPLAAQVDRSFILATNHHMTFVRDESISYREVKGRIGLASVVKMQVWKR